MATPEIRIPGVAREDIPAGAKIELDPATGYVRRARPASVVEPGRAWTGDHCGNPGCLACNPVRLHCGDPDCEYCQFRFYPCSNPSCLVCNRSTPKPADPESYDVIAGFPARTVYTVIFDGTAPIVPRPDADNDRPEPDDHARHPYAD